MEKSKFLFFVTMNISRKSSDFLKVLEITYQSIFLSAQTIILSRLKKIKKKYGKIENIFLRRWGFGYRSAEVRFS